MKIFKLAAAAALAVSSLTLSIEPAAAADQRGDRWEHRDNGRHNGWNNNRGRHNGWRRQRVCTTVWRHGHRQRVCRWVNRRWR